MANEEDLLARQAEANRIVKSYLGWTAGAGMIPFPIVDMALITGIQIKMVSDLATLYEVPFSRNAVKTILAGLVGSLVPGGLTRLASSWVKSIPGVGSVVGMAALPTFATASTYAVGKVFIKHFESGGNLMSFNTSAMRQHFKKEYEAGADKSGKTAAPAEDLATA